MAHLQTGPAWRIMAPRAAGTRRRARSTTVTRRPDNGEVDGPRAPRPPRFPLVLAVQYLGAESALDYTENLSEGGLFLRTERQFKRRREGEAGPLLPPGRRAAGDRGRGRPDPRGGARGAGRRGRARPRREPRRSREAHRPGAPHRRHREGSPSRRARILLVEDNHLVASMYAAALRRLAETDHLTGLGIEIVSDGAQAFDRLMREPKIDVLVTDLFMPVLSGSEMIEKVRNEPSIAGAADPGHHLRLRPGAGEARALRRRRDAPQAGEVPRARRAGPGHPGEARRHSRGAADRAAPRASRWWSH